MVVIVAHHQNQLVLSFRVPLVPLLPLTSIFFNVGLMMHLNPMTWLRFVVWMVLGKACVCVCVNLFLLFFVCYRKWRYSQSVSNEHENYNEISGIVPIS